jgi:hypothetical protein
VRKAAAASGVLGSMRGYRFAFLCLAVLAACVKNPAPEAPAAEPVASTREPAGVAKEKSKPTPPPAGSNNLFGLVRPASELAEPERVPSPDGTRHAFVKTEPKLGLWLSNADGTNAAELFDLASVRVENPPEGTSLARTTSITHVEFSVDGKRIYFQTDGWGTSLALYYFDIAKSHVRFVHDANFYQVIRSCKDKTQVGRLIILEHRYFDPIPNSAVDWFFLIDDQAKRYGIVGPESENVNRFLANTCGVGKAAPPGPSDVVPARLKKRLVCKNEVLRPKSLAFLDGTRAELFLLNDKDELAKDPKAMPMVLNLNDATQWAASQCP